MKTDRRPTHHPRSFLLAALAAGPFAPAALGCTATAEPKAVDASPAATTGTSAQSETLDGVLASAPAVCATSAGHYEVFVQGGGNTLWRRTYDDGVWGSWGQITGLDITSKPACVADARGQLSLFVRGPDGALWYRSRSSLAGSWSAWRSFGGWIADGPTVISDAPGHIDAFVQGGSNGVFRLKFRVEDVIPSGLRGGGNDGWSWEYMPGALAGSALSAVSWGPGRIDLFVRELGTNHLLHDWTNTAGASWGGWENKGGILDGGPSATSRGSGSFTVYVRGGDDEVYALPYSTATDWGTFTHVALDGSDALPISSDPAAIATTKSCDHVFARDRNNALYHRGCGERTGVKITNVESGATFETTTLDGFTFAYDSVALGTAATGRAGSSTRFSLVDARWPRELLVFDRSARDVDLTGTAFGVRYAKPIAGMQYASVPGYQPPSFMLTSDFGLPTTSSVAPWVAQSARLVDHGTCATRIPYAFKYVGGTVTPDSRDALFSNLSYAIDKGLEQATANANAAGAGVALIHAANTFTPTFLTKTGWTDPGANLDGFATHQKFQWSKGTPIGSATIELTVDATYQLTTRDGLLDVVPVVPAVIAVSTSTAYQIGQYLNPFAQFFGGALDDLFNIAPEVAGKDDWVNLVPKSIPPTGDIVAMIQYMFDTKLPESLRAQVYAQFQGVDAHNQPIGIGVCRGDLDATSQRQSCFDQRTLFMKAAVRDKLIANGMTAAAADARALELTTALRRDSFDCAQTSPGASDGVCRWHPYLPRVNVLPDRIEMVWYDGITASADYTLASMFAPASVQALMCSYNGADAVSRSGTL